MTATERVGRPARTIVEDVASLQRRAQAMLGAGDRLRAAARRQIESFRPRDARKQLRRTPIGDLKSLAGGGARLGRLHRAGFRTVGDVLDARPHELERVPGVGPRTVRQVTAAARRYEAELADTSLVRLDPERRHPAQTEFLATLAAIRAADAVAAPLREALTEFVARSSPLLAQARP